MVRAGQMVLAAGGWLPQLLPELSSILTIERAVHHWFPPASDDCFSPAKPSIFCWRLGCPLAVRAARPGTWREAGRSPRRRDSASVDSLRRRVSADEQASFRALAASYVAGLAPTPLDASVCFYTNTPDEHFLLDRHPRHPNVYAVSACSGHASSSPLPWASWWPMKSSTKHRLPSWRRSDCHGSSRTQGPQCGRTKVGPNVRKDPHRQVRKDPTS